MSGLVIVPNYMPALDRNGDPISGAKMFFYLNRTATLTTVYADAALLTELENPVRADSAGRFPLIFAASDKLFSVAVTTAAGAPIESYDDIGPSKSNTQGVSPLDFGAAYDGVTDDTAAHNAAAIVAAAAGAPLILPYGTTVIAAWVVPAIKAMTGQGIDLTVIKIKRQVYGNGDVIIALKDSCTLSKFTVDSDDAVLANIDPIGAYAVGSIGRVSFQEVSVRGAFLNGALFINIDDLTVSRCYFKSTSALSGRALQVISSTGRVTDNTVTGQFTSHLISVDSSEGVDVSGTNAHGANNPAFGISITNSGNVTVSGNYVENTGKEGLQMTLCNDSVMIGNTARWDDGIGNDFGISVDSCERCDVESNKLVNSYKAAVTLASDNAVNRVCRVRFNTGKDAATRATAAGMGAPHSAGFLTYTSLFDNTDNIWEGNTLDVSAGKTVTWGYLENDQGAQHVRNTRAKDFSFIGGGAVTNPFVILGFGTLLTREGFAAWFPALSAGTGAFTTFGAITARFHQDGAKTFFDVSGSVVNAGTAGGSLKGTLPVPPKGGLIGSVAGRETITGQALNGTIDPAGFSIFGDTSFPFVNGSNWIFSGWYENA